MLKKIERNLPVTLESERYLPDGKMVIMPGKSTGILNDIDFGNFISLADRIDYFQPFIHFTKTGMVPVEMFGILSVMADEEL